MITTILHFLGILFGVGAIGCAALAVMNMLMAIAFPKSMTDEAWPYAKKCYIFLGLMILSIVIGALLMTI
jgi:hypothetical protein